ncbi:hypothetical protein AruPA_05255 [Acidiphilium sp. PA]|uniref:hypothetical protein n=1 Tax=Acidiphilium sp. PA TaxID=2871705 RepID=UPI0022434C96|nr:hypothetical protein [Acidiphilium sp. PA]MCW8306436.1 hypothetical protein [Acidiphilium sp. PA]
MSAAAWSAPIATAERQAMARAMACLVAPGEPAASDPAALVEVACRDRVGLVSVTWPGVAAPLWVRAGTADAGELIGAMRDTAASLALPFAPRRIIEIGAGAGYRTVALAVAFTGATIASVEPVPAEARLHALNTLAWRQIIGMRAAIAESVTRFGLGRVAETGRTVLLPSADGPIGGMPLAAVMQQLGWEGVDLLVVDPGAYPDLARAGTAVARARVVAVRRPGPDLSEALAATHARETSGDWDLYARRAGAVAGAPMRRDFVFDVAGAAAVCRRVDVMDAPWAYFPIGDTGFRLHPNPAGTPAARLIVQHFMAGRPAFEVRVRLNHAAANRVRFGVVIRAAETGRVVHRAELVLGAAEARLWRFDVPLFFGEAAIEFATEMADGGSNGHAWAEFLDPVFSE